MPALTSSLPYFHRNYQSAQSGLENKTLCTTYPSPYHLYKLQAPHAKYHTDLLFSCSQNAVCYCVIVIVSVVVIVIVIVIVTVITIIVIVTIFTTVVILIITTVVA